ncbi:MAG: acyl carrier protein [Oscillospiraceae bacterium]|jgi:acyl carrier protein|nr:acyl carrier protein [Oscillospiraceae bacterium]
MTIEKVIEALADHLEMDASEITAETTFADLGVDSLDAVEILMEMEDVFGVEIVAGEAGTSVKELAAYIDAKANA